MFSAEKMVEIRKENNFTQKEMAKYLGFSESSYAMWECNREIVSIRRLMIFCEKFNVSVDYIFGFKVEKLLTKGFDITKQGERLKMFRKENKISQDKLADFLKVKRTMISNCETGRSILATIFLYEICNKYKIRADYLLGRIDEPMYWDDNK